MSKLLNKVLITLFIVISILSLRTTTAFAAYFPIEIQYNAHVQNIGWQGWVSQYTVAGTVGPGLRMEALQVKLVDPPAGLRVKYRVHVQDIGWQEWVYDGQVAGTVGQELRIEAIQIMLESPSALEYDVVYKAHVQKTGWQGWVNNGAVAGTVGSGLRMEALQVHTEVNDMYNTLYWANFSKSMKAFGESQIKYVDLTEMTRDLAESNREFAESMSRIEAIDFTKMNRDLAEANKMISDGLSGMIKALDMANQGMSTMNKGVNELNKTVPKIQESLDNANQGMATMNNGVNEINKTIPKIQEGLDNANQGMATMNKGVNEVNKTMPKIKESLDGANQGMTTMNNAVNRANKALNEMNSALNGMNNSTDIIIDALNKSNNGLGQTINGIDKSHENMERITEYLKLRKTMSNINFVKLASKPYEIHRLQSFLEGIYEAIGGTLKGANEFISNPIQAMNNIGQIVSNPDIIIKSIRQEFMKNVIFGDENTDAKFAGKLYGDTFIMLITTGSNEAGELSEVKNLSELKNVNKAVKGAAKSETKALKPGILKFKADEANIHFEKHGKEMMDALGKSKYGIKDYINDANYVIQNGTYVPELNGFVKLLGGKGSAKYSFVGINRATGNITTLHIKSVSELIKKAPSLGLGK